MKTKILSPLPALRNSLLTLCLLLGFGGNAWATTYYWDTTGTNSWGTGANWSDTATTGGTTGVVPLPADSAVFNQSSVNGTEIITLDAPQSITGITFSNTNTTTFRANASGTTARTLTLDNGGITVASTAGNVTFNDTPATYGVLTIATGTTTQTWTNNATTFSAGPVTGSGQLNLVGANSVSVNNIGQFSLNLSAYSGALNLSNVRLVNTVATDGFGTTGLLTINNGAQLGVNVASTTISRAISIAGNGWYDNAAIQRGAIRFLQSGTASSTVTLAADSRIVADNSRTGTFTGKITGGFGLEIGRAGGDTGTISFQGGTANDYSGLTTVSSGTLSLNKTATVNAIAGNVLVTSAGTLSNAADNQIADTATVTVDNTNATWTLNTKSETINTLNLSGGYTANKGFVTGVAGKLTVTNLNVSGGGVTLNSGGSTVTATTVTNTGGTWVFGTTSGTQSLVIGSGGLTIGGGSTMTVAGASNFISLGGNVTSQANANTNAISGAGTLRLNATRTFDVADGAAASDLTVSTIVTDGSGASGITKAGLGTMTLSGSNGYTGNTAVSSGTLAATKAVALSGYNSPGKISVANLATLRLNYGGGSDWVSSELDTLLTNNSSGFATGSTLALDTANGSGSYGTSIAAASFGLSKLGNNVLTLSGNNAYAGATSIAGTAGGIVAGANNALGTTAGNTTVAPGTSLGFSGGINYSMAETIVGSGAGTAAVGAFTALSRGFVQSVSGTNTFAGAIQINAGGISRIGTQNGSSLILTGPITMSGTTGVTVLFRAGETNGDFVTLSNSGNNWDTDTQVYTGNNNGSEYAGIRLGADNALPTAVGVSGANSSQGATSFDMNGYNQEVNGLAGTSYLKIVNLTGTASTSTLTLNVMAEKSSGITNIQDGPTGGVIAVVKTGTGTQTFTNTMTYTGTTSVNNGKLNINGALTASAVKVGSAAILSGSGSVGGTVTVTDGGILTAGFNDSGNLTLGELVFSGSGTVNVTGNGAVPGSVLNVTGSLTTSGNIAVNASNALGWTNGASYDLVTWGSIGGTGTSSFTVGSVLNLNVRQSAAPSFSGTSVILTINGDNPKWTGADNTNWVEGATGANSNWVLITGSTATNYISNDAVRFEDGAANYTVNISGSNVTPNSVTFNNSVSNDYTLESSGGFGIVGTATLTKDGGGTLIITSSNSYTGATTINAGILQIGDGTTDGSIASSSGITNNATLTYNLVGSQSYANAITGAAGLLIKNGGGTLTLSGTNSYGSGTIINTGTLVAASANALGTGGVTNDATLNLTAGAVTYTGLSTTLSGTGTANVTLGAGSASTILNGDYSSFTGTWNIGVGAAAGAGKVQMNGLDNAAATVNVLPNATLYVTTGGTRIAALTLGGGDTGESLGQLRVDGNALEWAGSVTLAGTVTGSNDYTFGGNATITVSGPINETGPAQSLIKGGNNTLILSNSNSYSGGTTISAGTLSVSATNNLGAPSANVVFNGGTLQITGTAMTNLGHTASTNSGKTVGISISDASNTFTFDQVLNQGTGALTKTGNGSLVLNQPNTYTGITTINGGTLSANTISDTTSSSIGISALANALTFGSTGGTLNFTGATGTTTRAITFTGQGTFDIANGSNLTVGTTTSSPTATDGRWSGSGGAIKTGEGTLTVRNNGDSTYATRFTVGSGYGGNFTMQAGTLAINPTQYFTIGDSATGYYYQTGGTANFTSSVTPADIYVGNGSGNGTMEIAGGTFLLSNTANQIRVGAGTAAGILTVGGGTSAALVDAYRVVLNTNPSASATGTLNLKTNGVLLVNFLTDAGVTGTSTVNFDGGTLKAKASNTGFMPSGFDTAAITSNGLTVDTNSFNVTIGQALSGSGGIIKTSAGILTLSGSNTYTGLTTVNNGTLNLNNAMASGTLSVVSGTMNVNSVTATGTSTTVSVAGEANFTGTNGQIYKVGSLNVLATGTATLTAHSGGAASVKVLDISSLIINGTTAFVGGVDKSGNTLAGAGFDTQLAGSGLASPAPVPEPGTIGLLAIGAIGGLLLRRRCSRPR